MKHVFLKTFMLAILLLLCNWNIFSQTNIKFDTIKNYDQLFFKSSEVKDTVQCFVKVTLIYKNSDKGWELLDYTLEDKVYFRLIGKNDFFRFSDKKIELSVSDTILEYANRYYRGDIHRFLSGFELDSLDKYRKFKGKLKLITVFSDAYICPTKKKR
jgi:hypothetical protein